MNITYLIGNGFDISLGIRTKYTDFYEYLKNNDSDKGIKNEILNSISNNIELWSDLELGLGNYTKHIGSDKDKLEKFYEDKFNLDMELQEYLRREQDRIDWNHDTTRTNVCNNFLNYISKFYNLFKHTEREDILKVINNSACKYNLISFNYTDIIEKCMIIAPSDAVKSIYLHGSLKGEDAILGVNDLGQINNEHFKESRELLVAMCKLEINNYIGSYTTQRAEEMLNTSSIVCIFGMSIGDTDKYWWNKIVSNIENGITERVIIFQYEPNLDKRNHIKVLRAQEKIKAQLLKYLGEDIEIQSDLNNKIKVLCNSDMFRLNLKLDSDSELEALVKEKELVAI